MSEQITIVSRVRGWFRKSRMDDVGLTDMPAETSVQSTSLFRPFARRDSAMQSLQQGFVTLTDLMVGIRENLENQGRRQDQLLTELAKLPAMLEQLPESARIQGETLKALHQELSQQHVQQQRLTEILDHVSKSNTSQREVLDGMSDRMDRMRQTDEQISNNLTSVGTTMQELGKNTTTSAQIMETLRDNMASRDNDLQQVLMRQGTRFTVMLAVAIFLSIAALVAVSIIGYLMLTRAV